MKITKRLAALLSSVALVHVFLLLGVLPTATAQDVDIIPFGATWDYLFTSIDDGSGNLMPADPFTANNVDFSNWTSVGFQTTTLTYDDGRSASWQSGPAPFYTLEANLVGTGTEFPLPAPNNRNVTQYFRHEFTTNQEYVDLTMSLIVDDGAVIYLDGQPVSSTMSCCRVASTLVDYDVADPNDPRFGQAPGYRDHSTVTNGPPPGSAEGTIYTEVVTALETLPPGPHVIGLETHQASTNSIDMQLDFRLTGTAVPEPAGILLLVCGSLAFGFVRRQSSPYSLPIDWRAADTHLNIREVMIAESAGGFQITETHDRSDPNGISNQLSSFNGEAAVSGIGPTFMPVPTDANT